MKKSEHKIEKNSPKVTTTEEESVRRQWIYLRGRRGGDLTYHTPSELATSTESWPNETSPKCFHEYLDSFSRGGKPTMDPLKYMSSTIWCPPHRHRRGNSGVHYWVPQRCRRSGVEHSNQGGGDRPQSTNAFEVKEHFGGGSSAPIRMDIDAPTGVRRLWLNNNVGPESESGGTPNSMSNCMSNGKSNSTSNGTSAETEGEVDEPGSSIGVGEGGNE